MNVRSVSPEAGGVLLPFRGHTDEARDDTEPSTGSAAAPTPTVVHLTGRRPRAGAETRSRPRWQGVGMVLAAVTVVGAGAVAASLTGVLPLSTERPVPRPAVSAPPTSASVESGNLPAAYGLCRAFDRAAQRGDDIATAQAFRNLAHAAGGASRVSAYCAPFQSLDPGRAR